MNRPIHIVHILYRFDTGGLENGVVNLVNRLDTRSYRHTIVSLTEHNPAYIQRIVSRNVDYVDMKKKSGNDVTMLYRIYRLLRRLQPDVVHSRNLAALECQIPAFFARTGHRIHGEHGWDTAIEDIKPKHIWLRRLLRPILQGYVALSTEGYDFLQQKVQVKKDKLHLICNGVDTQRFAPNTASAEDFPPHWNLKSDIIFGCIGRMATVKNHHLLADAFIDLFRVNNPPDCSIRLAIIGDGNCYATVEQKLIDAGLQDQIWLPGVRTDIPQLLNTFSVFVLPSLAEGISNTILEAMASAKPVVATRVGGNPDLVVDNRTGFLVTSNDKSALATAMQHYIDQPEKIVAHGHAGHKRVRSDFSLEQMVAKYAALYASNS